jgi:hypothetical protein
VGRPRVPARRSSSAPVRRVTPRVKRPFNPCESHST